MLVWATSIFFARCLLAGFTGCLWVLDLGNREGVESLRATRFFWGVLRGGFEFTSPPDVEMGSPTRVQSNEHLDVFRDAFYAKVCRGPNM